MPEVDVPGHGTIHNAVRADIDAREAQGNREYGRAHRLFNGHDGLWEAYEEALDLVFWLRQHIEERAPAEAASRARERDRLALLVEGYASTSRDAIGGTAMRHAYANAARMIREAGDA